MPGTPKIRVYCCALNHSFVQNFFFWTKVIFIQGVFKNNQELLWKIQGLFKDIPQFFNFQGLFKAHANHDVQYWELINHFLYVQIIRMVTLETNPPKPFFENDELVVSLDLISP